MVTSKVKPRPAVADAVLRLVNSGGPSIRMSKARLVLPRLLEAVRTTLYAPPAASGGVPEIVALPWPPARKLTPAGAARSMTIGAPGHRWPKAGQQDEYALGL